ncbi:MAG: system NifU family Fe-S cluster assembly protein [Microbacteriaceae bacterium]|jgi:nitrogen fixation NifU-like protein|nr:system NifU family Fe-S cluster assembly protein [Microbacteriaceae bacterium]
MSTSDLENLYQEVILEHAKRPHGVGLTEGANGESHQVNPTCGDEITLQLHLDADSGAVRELRWEGHGCAISQASASLLTDLAAGLTVPELTSRIDDFRVAMRSRGTIEPDEEVFGDAVVLGGVSKYMARVKCAMLAWVAAEHALAQSAA